jgi:hypothetical protein
VKALISGLHQMMMTSSTKCHKNRQDLWHDYKRGKRIKFFFPFSFLFGKFVVSLWKENQMSTETHNTTNNEKYTVIGIRVIILVQAITFLFSSIVWLTEDDLDKWFTRWALGILLLSAWGIMKHISINKN